MEKDVKIKLDGNMEDTQLKFYECCFISIPQKFKRAIWEVTHFCPKDCKYCFTSSDRERKKNLDFFRENYNKIIDKFTKLDVRDVLMTGGEPLIFGDDLINAIKLLKSLGITFSISTTGYPLPIFKKVLELNPRMINLSFDPMPLNNGYFWKSDLNALKELLDFSAPMGVNIKLTSVITKENIKNFKSFLNILLEVLEVYKDIKKVAITNIYPIGKALQEKRLSLKEFAFVNKTIQETELPAKVPTFLVNFPSLNTPLQKCPAGKTIFSIMPNGNFTPCSLLYNLSRNFGLGHIVRDDIDTLKFKLESFSMGVCSHIQEIKQSNKICKSKCEEKNICGGGCFVMMPVRINRREKILCKLQPKIVKDFQKELLDKIERPVLLNHEISYATSGQKATLARSQEGKIREFVRRNLRDADLTHNFEHIECVVSFAKEIAEKEKANLKIVVPAAYFHDVILRSPSMHGFHTLESATKAAEFLEKLSSFSEEEIKHIKDCIISSSYGSFLLGIEPASIEAKVVRDADWLDAIGARGIARVFAFAGTYKAKEMGEVKFNPEFFPIQFDMNLTGPDPSPIYHFYTKLLKLKDSICTQTGKKIAEERHKFMIEFLKKYAEESPLPYNTKKSKRYNPKQLELL